jgi:hypothetical protein
VSALEYGTLVDPLTQARGFREVATLANPAAGADLTIPLEGRYVTRLLALALTLTADATVGDRRVLVRYVDGAGRIYAASGAAVDVPESTAATFYFNVHQPELATVNGNNHLVPLSPLFLPPGHSLTAHIFTAGAADQLSGISVTWERFWTDDAA